LNDRKRIIEFAVVGAVASVICIVTPVADWFLSALGLQAWIPSLRLVLVPLMAMCVGLGIGTAWLRKRSKNDADSR